MGSQRDVNCVVARVFGALLIVTGLLGFAIPPKKAVTSGAPAYNAFHLVFGAFGIVASRRASSARAFNVGFGAIDLYQAAASRRGWFPRRWFRWKVADDVLHVGVGTALLAIGLIQSDRRGE